MQCSLRLLEVVSLSSRNFLGHWWEVVVLLILELAVFWEPREINKAVQNFVGVEKILHVCMYVGWVCVADTWLSQGLKGGTEADQQFEWLLLPGDVCGNHTQRALDLKGFAFNIGTQPVIKKFVTSIFLADNWLAIGSVVVSETRSSVWVVRFLQVYCINILANISFENCWIWSNQLGRQCCLIGRNRPDWAGFSRCDNHLKRLG